MQRLYLLRKLNDFGVSQNILEMVYKNLSFNMATSYRHSDVKCKLSRVVIIASKITVNPSHPLYPQFKLLPSGRRFRLPQATKNVYKK